MLRAAGFVALLVLSGSVLARAGRLRADLFAATWWGLALTSLVGVVLARSGQFSLTRLAFVVGGVALAMLP